MHPGANMHTHLLMKELPVQLVELTGQINGSFFPAEHLQPNKKVNNNVLGIIRLRKNEPSGNRLIRIIRG